MRSNSPFSIVHCSFFIVHFSLFIALVLASCTARKSTDEHLEAVPLRYATNLTCERGDGYSLWTLRNPWDTTQVLHRYLLVKAKDSQDSPPALPKGREQNESDSQNPTRVKGDRSLPIGRAGRESSYTTIIHVPLRHAGIATAVHCGLLDELGISETIAGVCEKQYIDLPAVTRGLANGHIADFGNGMNPNVERIMDVAPDALLLTPFEHSGGYGRVERLGIPIVECAEYMEVSPLARAEWIRFYGELFGVASKADSIFRAVEANYLTLKQQVTTYLSENTTTATLSANISPSAHTATSPSTHTATPSTADTASSRSRCSDIIAAPSSPSPRPRLLTEMLYGGQWFVPCGQSTMGIMFADAGADYIFRNRPGSGSTALSFETVLDEAQDADIWLLKYNSQQPLTYSQLARDYQPYTRFRAFRERHIFACDLAHNHFYEETPFHPDRLLRDLIILFHPDLLPGEEPHYYQPLP